MDMQEIMAPVGRQLLTLCSCWHKRHNTPRRTARRKKSSLVLYDRLAFFLSLLLFSCFQSFPVIARSTSFDPSREPTALTKSCSSSSSVAPSELVRVSVLSGEKLSTTLLSSSSHEDADNDHIEEMSKGLVGDKASAAPLFLSNPSQYSLTLLPNVIREMQQSATHALFAKPSSSCCDATGIISSSSCTPSRRVTHEGVSGGLSLRSAFLSGLLAQESTHLLSGCSSSQDQDIIFGRAFSRSSDSTSNHNSMLTLFPPSAAVLPRSVLYPPSDALQRQARRRRTQLETPFGTKVSDENKGEVSLVSHQTANPSNPFFSILFDCAKEAWGDVVATRQCLTRTLLSSYQVVISPQCSQCYAISANCGARSCWSVCTLFGDCGSKCLQCASVNCQPALRSCTQLSTLPLPCSSEEAARKMQFTN